MNCYLLFIWVFIRVEKKLENICETYLTQILQITTKNFTQKLHKNKSFF